MIVLQAAIVGYKDMGKFKYVARNNDHDTIVKENASKLIKIIS